MLERTSEHFPGGGVAHTVPRRRHFEEREADGGRVPLTRSALFRARHAALGDTQRLGVLAVGIERPGQQRPVRQDPRADLRRLFERRHRLAGPLDGPCRIAAGQGDAGGGGVHLPARVGGFRPGEDTVGLAEQSAARSTSPPAHAAPMALARRRVNRGGEPAVRAFSIASSKAAVASAWSPVAKSATPYEVNIEREAPCSESASRAPLTARVATSTARMSCPASRSIVPQLFRLTAMRRVSPRPWLSSIPSIR